MNRPLCAFEILSYKLIFRHVSSTQCHQSQGRLQWREKVGEWADGLAKGLDSACDSLNHTADSLKEGFRSLKKQG